MVKKMFSKVIFCLTNSVLSYFCLINRQLVTDANRFLASICYRDAWISAIQSLSTRLKDDDRAMDDEPMNENGNDVYMKDTEGMERKRRKVR